MNGFVADCVMWNGHASASVPLTFFAEVLLEVLEEWCVRRSVQSEIAARGVRIGGTQRGKKGFG
eukprot:758619-Pelagomonas_calceolata.AAC.1